MKVCIFGAGHIGKNVALPYLKKMGVEVMLFLDNSKTKSIKGIPCIHPEQFNLNIPVLVCLNDLSLVENILKQLKKLKIEAFPFIQTNYSLYGSSYLPKEFFNSNITYSIQFYNALKTKIMACLQNNFNKHNPKTLFYGHLYWGKGQYNGTNMDILEQFLQTHTKAKSFLYNNVDEKSKELLIDTSCYAILGSNKVKLKFTRTQYYCSKVRISKKDTILDVGAYTGDSAIPFAKKAINGEVYSFEPIKENLLKFYQNIKEHKELSSRIFIIKKAVSDKSGKNLKFAISESSSNSNCTKNQTQNICSVNTISIDDFVKKKNIVVDFIKMDIEGAEMEALKGARETIKKHKPKLAICVYHKLTDFYSIPKFIQSLNKSYKFYLEHHSKDLIETVLYCSI